MTSLVLKTVQYLLFSIKYVKLWSFNLVFKISAMLYKRTLDLFSPKRHDRGNLCLQAA